MSLKVTYSGSILFLQALVDSLLAAPDARVYQNDYTPIGTSVYADFTEADFDGYALVSVTDFSAASLNVDNKAQSEAGLITWTMTGAVTPNTVYGVFITNATPALLYAERDPAGGVVMNAAGLTFSYKPRITLKSEF